MLSPHVSSAGLFSCWKLLFPMQFSFLLHDDYHRLRSPNFRVNKTVPLFALCPLLLTYSMTLLSQILANALNRVWNFFSNKKYVRSNSESVQCNFYIFDHTTFIQFKICCCVQSSSKSDDFSLRYGNITIFKMAAVRHLEFWKFLFL